MNRYFGSISIELENSCYEIPVDKLTIEEFEELYGSCIDSGDEIISINLVRIYENE